MVTDLLVTTWASKSKILRSYALVPIYLSGGSLDASTDPPEQSRASTGDLLPYLVLLEDRISFDGCLDPVEERHFS